MFSFTASFLGKYISLEVVFSTHIDKFSNTFCKKVLFYISYLFSDVEQDTPRRTVKLIPRKTRPCQEFPDVLTFSHLRTLFRFKLYAYLRVSRESYSRDNTIKYYIIFKLLYSNLLYFILYYIII